MAGTFGFAIEMVISTHGESFHISGDERRVVLDFSSVRSLIRVLRMGSVTKYQLPDYVLQPSFEATVNKIPIMRSGEEVNPDVIARCVGLRSTRFYLNNLIRVALRLRR